MTIEDLESLSAQLEDANTRMAEGTLGPSAFIDHPLFGLALEAHFKKHPPGGFYFFKIACVTLIHR